MAVLQKKIPVKEMLIQCTVRKWVVAYQIKLYNKSIFYINLKFGQKSDYSVPLKA